MNFCAFVAFVRPFALVRVCPGKGSGSVDCRLCRGCHLVIVTSCRIFGQQATHSKQTNEASRIGRRINPHRGLHHTLQRPLSTHTHTHTKRHSRARSSPQGSHSWQSREGGALPNVISLQLSDSISNIVIDDDIATRWAQAGGGRRQRKKRFPWIITGYLAQLAVTDFRFLYKVQINI